MKKFQFWNWNRGTGKVQNQFETAEQKYQEFRQKYPDLEQRIPLKYIASYLGITQQFLSVLRSNF